ncbi:hypothetical protein [Azospirillum sp. sgz302134]
MNPFLAGALAGLAATVPMTWAMNRLHRQLPERARYPLPPRLITERVATEAGVGDAMTERQHELLALAGHYAYGAATGAGFAPVLRAVGGAPVATGVAYGLGVWAASYLGWIPAVGILRPATEHPAERVGMMLAAHVVWGGATGYLTARLSDWGTERSPARGAWTARRVRGTDLATESAAPEQHRDHGRASIPA